MTVAIIEEHRADLTALRKLAVSDLAAVVAVIRGLDPAEAREALKEAIPDLMDPFMGAASDAAAVLLEELYAQARMQIPEIRPAALLEPARVDSLARWAVAPMADDTLDGTVLGRLTGAATRMIFDSARTTTVDGVTRAPSGNRIYFQRMPRGDCCAFCGMLASRPIEMSYTSAWSAGQVTGRGSTRTGFDAAGNRLSGGIGGGVKARGNQALSEKFHDDCRCLAVPILRGSTADAIAASRETWQKKYAQALPEQPSAGMSLAERTAAIRRGESVIDATDAKTVLANWRKIHGTH